MNLAGSSGSTRLYLASQSDKVPFYEKLGFTAFGDEFEEAGIPHRAMKTY
jgi:predicted GNAT family N-acyltransferase